MTIGPLRTFQSFLIDTRQVSQHGVAGSFGLSERFEGRAANLDCGPVLIDRTPRRYKACVPVKAGTAAALVTNHE